MSPTVRGATDAVDDQERPVTTWRDDEERCRVCTGLLEWSQWDTYRDGTVTGTRRRLPHTDQDCRRFAALSEEEWPSSLLAALSRVPTGGLRRRAG